MWDDLVPEEVGFYWLRYDYNAKRNPKWLHRLFYVYFDLDKGWMHIDCLSKKEIPANLQPLIGQWTKILPPP